MNNEGDLMKRNICNNAQSVGKYEMYGVKFPGKEILRKENFEKESIIENKKLRKFVTKEGTITSCVNFKKPKIGLTVINSMKQNCNDSIIPSPVEALKSTLSMAENVLDGTLSLKLGEKPQEKVNSRKEKEMER